MVTERSWPRTGPAHVPRSAPRNRLEHPALDAWFEVCAGCRRSGIEEAAAVSVAAMVPSLTAVDADGVPIGPGLLYGDERGPTDAYGAS